MPEAPSQRLRSVYARRTRCCQFMVVSALLNLFVGMPVALLVVLPNNFAQIVEMLTVMDTFEKWNATAGQPGSMPFKHCFFNLTNGHALLTATPTPVPAFEEVCVELKIEAQSFDFELSDDESEYTSKTWSRMGVVNPYDWNLEFVTLNPNLLALLASVGGETALSYAVPSLYGALQMDAAVIKADGTGALNEGLFVRHTLHEIFRGYTSALTMQPALPASAMNIYLGYESRADLEAAIADGTAVGLMGAPSDGGREFTTTMKTGKGRPKDIGRLGAIKGARNLSAIPPADAMWLWADPGWDGTGDMSATRGTLVLDGIPIIGSQPPLGPREYPTLTAAGLRPIGVVPSFGERVTLFDSAETLRNYNFECDNGCAGERLHNAVAVQRYSLTSDTWQLTSGGVRDDTGMCAFTLTGCDYGMREPHGIVLGGSFTTLPYMGNSSRRQLVSLQPYGGGAELHYDTSMGTGRSLWFEPFTGMMLQSESNLQTNTIIAKALLDGPLYGHVFGQSVLDPIFVWPGERKHVSLKLDAAAASAFGGPSFGLGPDTLYALILLTLILTCWCGVIEQLRNSAGYLKPKSAADAESTKKILPQA